MTNNNGFIFNTQLLSITDTASGAFTGEARNIHYYSPYPDYSYFVGMRSGSSFSWSDTSDAFGVPTTVYNGTVTGSQFQASASLKSQPPGSNYLGSVVGSEIPYTDVLSVGIQWPTVTANNSTHSGVRGDLDAANVNAAFSSYLARPQNFGLDVSNYQVDALAAGGQNTFASIVNYTNQALAVLHPGDTFVFYLSSHGLPGSVAIANDHNLSSTDIADIFKTPRWAGINKLFIMDSCYSGSLWSDGNGGGLGSLPKTALLASSPAGLTTLFDSGTGRSFFSMALAQALVALKSSIPPNQLSLDALASLINIYGIKNVNDFLTTNGVGFVQGPQDLWNVPESPVWTDVVSYETPDFSLVPVAEPRTVFLVALGLLALILVRARPRFRRSFVGFQS